MYYVLLSGGSGRRLWPLSNEARPKQYLKLVNKEDNSMERCSMLQRVWAQLKSAGMAADTVITAGPHRGGAGAAGHLRGGPPKLRLAAQQGRGLGG